MVEKRLMNVRNRWMKRRIIQWTSKWWLDAFHIKKVLLSDPPFSLYSECLFLAVGEENEMQFSYCFFPSTLCVFFSISLHSHAISIAKIRPPHSAYTYISSSTENNTRKSFHTGKLSWMWRTRHTRQQFATIIQRIQLTMNVKRREWIQQNVHEFTVCTLSCLFSAPSKSLALSSTSLPLGTTRWHNGTSFPGVVSECTQSANIQRLNEVEEVVLGAPRSCFERERRRRRKKLCPCDFSAVEKSAACWRRRPRSSSLHFRGSLEGKERGEKERRRRMEQREEVLENKRDIYVIFLMMLVFFIHSRSFFFVFGVFSPHNSTPSRSSCVLRRCRPTPVTFTRRYKW